MWNTKFMKVIGIQGGMCTGKSTILNSIENGAVVVIGVDKILRELYFTDTETQGFIQRITQPYIDADDTLTNCIMRDSILDRAFLCEIITKHPEVLIELENATYHKVIEHLNEFVERARLNGKQSCWIENWNLTNIITACDFKFDQVITMDKISMDETIHRAIKRNETVDVGFVSLMYEHQNNR